MYQGHINMSEKNKKDLSVVEKEAQMLIDRFQDIIGRDSHHVSAAAIQCALKYCDGMIEERERTQGIANEFRDKYKTAEFHKTQAGNKLAFIEDEKAEVARYIANAISGHNALTFTLKIPDYWVQVKNIINDKY